MARNVPGHFLRQLSGWRHVATTTWQQANDPTIYGTLDVEVGAACEYVDELSARSGRRVTMTHLVTKALADTLAAHPECNAYVRLGRIYQREDVDVFVLVAVPPQEPHGTHEQKADLTGVKVRNADRKSVVEIADEVAASARTLRTGEDPALGPVKRLMGALPPAVVRRGLSLITALQYELNLSLGPVGIPRDPFGCAIVTSLGMYGIDHAFPPLIPMTRLSALLAVGRVEDRAVVRDGEVVARPMLPLTATFDHRVIDGYQGAKLAETFRGLLADPGANFG